MQKSNDFNESKESVGPGTIMLVGGASTAQDKVSDYADKSIFSDGPNRKVQRNESTLKKKSSERNRRSLGTLQHETGTVGITVTLDSSSHHNKKN